MGCSTLSVTAAESRAKTPAALSRPSRRCPDSAIRAPARIPSRTVSSAKPSSAIVTTTGASAPARPSARAVSGSRVNVTSAPWPSSHTSTEPRQKISQSGAKPNCAAQMIVSGTRGIAIPMATPRTASKAAKSSEAARS